jgi:hypothetical protein
MLRLPKAPRPSRIAAATKSPRKRSPNTAGAAEDLTATLPPSSCCRTCASASDCSKRRVGIVPDEVGDTHLPDVGLQDNPFLHLHTPGVVMPPPTHCVAPRLALHSMADVTPGTGSGIL